MMGKVCVEIDHDDGLRPAVNSLLARMGASRWESRDMFYRKKSDLRKIGIPAVLHIANLNTGNHQAELVGSDAMSYKAILGVLCSITPCDPRHLSLMRLDLSVDVPGYSVDWFAAHARVARKKIVQIFGRRSSLESQDTTGLYIGGTRDRLRIYDKLEELAYRGKPLHFPFATWKTDSCPALVTRVERQFRGSKIPKNLRYIGSLKTAGDFNPFSQVRFEVSRRVSFGEASVMRVLAASGLRILIEDKGMQGAKALINKHSSGNAARIMGSLTHLEPESCPDLYGIYQGEVHAQLEGE